MRSRGWPRVAKRHPLHLLLSCIVHDGEGDGGSGSLLQQQIDLGIDPWQVHGDTLTARAYDLHIEQLRESGLNVEILAQDAAKWEGEK